MICTKHQISMGKHLIVVLLRKSHPDDFLSEIAFFLVSPVIQLNNSIINDGKLPPFIFLSLKQMMTSGFNVSESAF